MSLFLSRHHRVCTEAIFIVAFYLTLTTVKEMSAIKSEVK